MNINLPDGVSDALTGAISAVVAWFLSSRKTQADIKSAELANEEKAAEIWKDLSMGLKDRLDQVSAKVEALQNEIFALKQENQMLRMQLGEFVNKPKHNGTDIA